MDGGRYRSPCVDRESRVYRVQGAREQWRAISAGTVEMVFESYKRTAT